MVSNPKLPKDLTELRFPLMEVNPINVEIVIGVHCFFNDEKKVAAWLTTKNPHFGYIAPLKVMQLGKSQKVLDFVNNAIHEYEGEI